MADAICLAMNSIDQGVTSLLNDLAKGDKQAASKLMPLVYSELHRLARNYMRRERVDHTLQATALVNEAYLKLVEQRSVDWKGRAHFFGMAAHIMRRILIDHARSQMRDKRGGEQLRCHWTKLWFSPLNNLRNS